MKTPFKAVFSAMLIAVSMMIATAMPSQALDSISMETSSVNAQTVGKSASDTASRLQFNADENLNIQPMMVIRICDSGYFGFNNFPQLHEYLSITKGWYLNNKNVWQSPSDDATWEVYCRITASAAVMNLNGAVRTVTPSPVYLTDGTRIDFRTVSTSGGYTIDMNVSGVTYKVHRI